MKLNVNFLSTNPNVFIYRLDWLPDDGKPSFIYSGASPDSPLYRGAFSIHSNLTPYVEAFNTRYGINLHDNFKQGCMHYSLNQLQQFVPYLLSNVFVDDSSSNSGITLTNIETGKVYRSMASFNQLGVSHETE